LQGSWMPTNNLTAKMSYDQGVACFENRDFDTAADHFRNAVTVDAQFTEAHERLAESYEKLGYAHRARKAWEALSRVAKDPALLAKVKAKLGA
jgi:Tfp pilus assembly protein PilF